MVNGKDAPWDEVTIDVRAPTAGVVQSYKVAEGDTVTVGQQIAVFVPGAAGEAAAAAAPAAKPAAAAAAPAPTPAPAAAVAPKPAAAAAPAPPPPPAAPADTIIHLLRFPGPSTRGCPAFAVDFIQVAAVSPRDVHSGVYGQTVVVARDDESRL